MKIILKYKFKEQEGFLSCAEKDGKLFALVKKDTDKVKDIMKTGKLLLSKELKAPIYMEYPASVSFDQAWMTWTFKKLEEDKNLYFKAIDDTLCLIIISMKLND